MTKFKLGQRVKVKAYRYKSKGAWNTKWELLPLAKPFHGVVTGKRNVAEGHTDWSDGAEAFIFHPSKHLSLYLVAKNLTSVRYVAEEDMEAIDANS